MPDEYAGAALRRRTIRGSESILLVAVASVGLAFGIGAAFQTAALQIANGESRRVVAVSFVLRFLVNAGTIGLTVVLVSCMRLARRAPAAFLRATILIAVLAGAARADVQYELHLQIREGWGDAVTEGIAAAAVIVLCMAIGKYTAELSERLESQELRATQQAERATAALEALHSEELRVRREVADGLHGGVQQRLVLASIRMGEIANGAGAGAPIGEIVPALNSLRKEIDELRDVDLRELTRLLYPDALEIGLAQAVRAILGRIPPSIAVNLDVDDKLSDVDETGRGDIQRRLMLVRVVEEGISNALRHGHASRLHVWLAVVDGRVCAEVEDNGKGVSAGAHLRGLARLRYRLESIGGSLELAVSTSLGGAVLRAQLPIAADRR